MNEIMGHHVCLSEKMSIYLTLLSLAGGKSLTLCTFTHSCVRANDVKNMHSICRYAQFAILRNHLKIMVEVVEFMP